MTMLCKGTLTVAAGILWNNSKFLACRRPEGKPLQGFWEFPGGKAEPGESAACALERELLEELGIRIASYRHFLTRRAETEDRLLQLHFYNVYGFYGDIQPRENQLVRWVTPQEALTLEFLPPDQGILEMLVAHDPR